MNASAPEPGHGSTRRSGASWSGTKPRRPSQLAISKAAGVSRTTVSLALRGGQGLTAETQARVLAVARKMGYRPNALVHSIRSGRSRTVGVLAHPHDSYWRSVCHGIHDRLVDADHLPLFLWNNENAALSPEAYAVNQIHRLLDRWVDGVILWPYFAALFSQHLQEFETRNIPVITIDHQQPDIAADSVESDEPMIARLIVSHLTALGHRRFLIITGPEGVGWADNRSAAIAAELRAAGVARGDVDVLRVALKGDVSPDVRRTLVARPGVTAVIPCTDSFALAVYRAAAELRLAIPERLSVIGVADLDFASLISPALTTIRQDGYEIGRQAAQLELERSAGLLTGPPRQLRLPVSLIERGSTARAAVVP